MSKSIDDSQEYGSMIALTCKNHPELTWRTKNIDYIGARTIFFHLSENLYQECDCHVRELIVKPTS